MRQVAHISFVLVFLATGIQSRPLDELKSNGHPTDPGCSPPRCLHESKCYADGEEMSRRSDGSGGCHGLLCSHGQSVAWDDFNCGQATTVPATTPGGCFKEGVWYPKGREISRGSDGQGWCYGEICGDDGKVQSWDDFHCDRTTTEQPTTVISTTYPSTPTPTRKGCYYDGAWYPLGSYIRNESNGQGWCYGLYCDHHSGIIVYDNFNCDPSTTPRPTTIPLGCLQNGIWYPPSSDISRGSDSNGWCYGQYCDENGHVVAWDDWNCGPVTTTETPSSTPSPSPAPTPSTSATTTPLGCLQNGIWYPPGSEISRKSDGNGWCYGQLCDQNGQVVAWDDWNCGEMTITETPSSTHSTTPTPLGCLQNGVWYPAGSEISRGSDGEGWCYGEYCTRDGKLQLWDDFNCKTSPPTTLPTTSPKGCYYEGKWYPTGIFEGTNVRGCRYGAQCGLNGQVTRWEEFDCRL